MKKMLGFILVALLCLGAFGGTGQKKDVLMYSTDRNALTTPVGFSYNVDLGEKVAKATVTAEYWKAGQMVDYASLLLDDTTETFSTTFDVASLNEATEEKNVNLQMNVNSAVQEHHEVVMRQFLLPASVCGYTIDSHEGSETLVIAPGDEIILGGIAFDIGEGVTGIDKKGLIEAPNRLNDYDCIIIVRAKFE